MIFDKGKQTPWIWFSLLWRDCFLNKHSFVFRDRCWRGLLKTIKNWYVLTEMFPLVFFFNDVYKHLKKQEESWDVTHVKKHCVFVVLIISLVLYGVNLIKDAWRKLWCYANPNLLSMVILFQKVVLLVCLITYAPFV